MKNNMRKIVVATSMLLISALLMGTSTFAWFAMNTRSNADGLEVEAYSDSLYLEISQTIDSNYAPNTVFDSDNTGTLRLVTHKFYDENEIVTVTATPASGNYDGNGTYYKAADSDKAGADLNYVYANDELEDPDSITGLYTNIGFVLVTSNEQVSGTYYTLSQNKYTSKELTNESAKGMWKAVYYQNADDTYSGTVTYYEKVNGEFVKLDTDDSYASTDMSTYYVQGNGLNQPLDSSATYDAGSIYYANVGTASVPVFAITSIELGSSLNGYYTISETAVDSTATHGDGTSVYYLKNEVSPGIYDYSYIGTIATTEKLENYLYWGRAYSSDPTLVDENNTLNIIGESDAANYYLTKTLYLRQAEGTEHADNLRIAGVDVGGATNVLSPALRVLFVARSLHDQENHVVYVYDNGDGKFYDKAGTEVDADEVILCDLLLGNEAETIEVDLYIYFDGTDDVAMNTDAVLNGQTIDIEFAIDDHDYN